jgi:hypothetical protein
VYPAGTKTVLVDADMIAGGMAVPDAGEPAVAAAEGMQSGAAIPGRKKGQQMSLQAAQYQAAEL